MYYNKIPNKPKEINKIPPQRKSTTMKPTEIAIYFDGACHNKPGLNQPMGVGVAVLIDGQVCYKECIAVHYVVEEPLRGTSNVAEWQGCVLAMNKASELHRQYNGECVIQVYADSQLIARQFNGDYLIKNGDFLKYERVAMKWAKLAGIKTINWIKREHNHIADTLSKIALKKIEKHEYFEKGLPMHHQHLPQTT